MKAVVHTRYGRPEEALQIRDVAKPVPQANELLVRVVCSTVNRTDAGFLRATPFITRFFSGLVRPRHTSLGCEFAGEVEAVGPAVTRLGGGDRVFGFDDTGWGGHAEYKVIEQDRAVATIPDGITYEQAATSTEGGRYALVYVRAAEIARGDRVLVHGATGAIGSAAVQLLVHAGARVVATSPTRQHALVASLGADRVIDHEQADFTACSETFRLAFDAVGKSSFGATRRLLEPRGISVSTDLGPWAQNPLLGLASPLYELAGAKRVLFPIPRCSQEHIEFLKQRLSDGSFNPVIDRTYGLDEIVEAFRYVETGKKIGNVAVRVAQT